MAKQKMSYKQFIKAFNDCGYDFGIWGWDGILNLLACYGIREAEYQRQLGNECLAELEDNRRRKIHDILEDRGYYKD